MFEMAEDMREEGVGKRLRLGGGGEPMSKATMASGQRNQPGEE